MTGRNAAAIAAGRVTLSRASVDQLPPSLAGPFDAILTVEYALMSLQTDVDTFTRVLSLRP